MLFLLFPLLMLLQNLIHIDGYENRQTNVLANPKITTNATFTNVFSLNGVDNTSSSSTGLTPGDILRAVDTEADVLITTQNTATSTEATANVVLGRSNTLTLNPYSILLPNGFDSQVPPAQPMLYPTLVPLNLNAHLTKHSNTTAAAASFMLGNSWHPLWPATKPMHRTLPSTPPPTATILHSKYKSFEQQHHQDSGDVRITSVIYGDWKPLLTTIEKEKNSKSDSEHTSNIKFDKKTIINRQNGGFIGQITQKPLAANSNEIHLENFKSNNSEFNRRGLLDGFLENPHNYKFRPAIFIESKKNSTKRTQQNEMERKNFRYSNDSRERIAGDNLAASLWKEIAAVNNSGNSKNNNNSNNSKITLENIKNYKEIPTRLNWPQDFIDNSLSAMLAIRSQTETTSISNHDDSAAKHTGKLRHILNAINVTPALFRSQLPGNITEIGRSFKSMSTTHEPLLCIPISLKIANNFSTTEERIYCFPPILMNTMAFNNTNKTAKETTALIATTKPKTTLLKIQPITKKSTTESSRPQQQQTKVIDDDDDDDLQMTGDDDDDDDDDDSYAYVDDGVHGGEGITGGTTTFNCCNTFAILLTFLCLADAGGARIN